MTEPSTQKEYDAWVMIHENWRYLISDELNERCLEFQARIDAGELMTVQEAADFCRLPVNIFRHLYAYYLTHETERLRITRAVPPTPAVN